MTRHGFHSREELRIDCSLASHSSSSVSASAASDCASRACRLRCRKACMALSQASSQSSLAPTRGSNSLGSISRPSSSSSSPSSSSPSSRSTGSGSSSSSPCIAKKERAPVAQLRTTRSLLGHSNCYVRKKKEKLERDRERSGSNTKQSVTNNKQFLGAKQQTAFGSELARDS